MFVRARGNHRICGATTLQNICIAKTSRYGPRTRFVNANHSVAFPEYQAMNHSIA